MQNIITVIGATSVVFSFADGYKWPRVETLIEQARKGDEELQCVCLWLENHGQHDLTEALLERFT